MIAAEDAGVPKMLAGFSVSMAVLDVAAGGEGVGLETSGVRALNSVPLVEGVMPPELVRAVVVDACPPNIELND